MMPVWSCSRGMSLALLLVRRSSAQVCVTAAEAGAGLPKERTAGRQRPICRGAGERRHGERVHVNEIPSTAPSANVTPAAAAPMKTWRSAESSGPRPLYSEVARPMPASAAALNPRLQ